MWGFARHEVVPDIAVIGKPMGNGMPIAAAIMKSDIQDVFRPGYPLLQHVWGQQRFFGRCLGCT
ncbi:aminotransferase class III-fold pyridoxal phosphate-dependent enzyme [Rhizobium leguminosarum]|uniref:aminotransferase class III-fold pyridoxal phosphate-dependent enzyme n=1 Tax=Rhizobium leguminosarum TaxID=384 RepID=UPI003D7C224E